MFSKTRTEKSTLSSLQRISEEIGKADAVLVGIGAGLSTASGFTYSGKRFEENFADFEAKFGIKDMYSGGFYPFKDRETYWAWWSRMININRYEAPAGQPYLDLLSIIKAKDYFVITTNVDHQLQKAGFDKGRLFYTQGDYGLFQCSVPCHKSTYDNEDIIKRMVKEQEDMKIPSSLIPHCPVCGKEMRTNLREDERFVEDEGWNRAAERYGDFIRRHAKCRTLYLELGVGWNTPSIIKFSFWKLTAQNPNAVFASIDLNAYTLPPEIEKRSITVAMDLAQAMSELRSLCEK